jgi:hypothetical protein
MITSTDYPLLTREFLAALEKKVDAMLTTKQDCELIDHYMTSIGWSGFLLARFREEGVDSFDDIDEALIEDPDDDDDLTADGVTGYLLGCIHVLQIRLKRGEKIY